MNLAEGTLILTEAEPNRGMILSTEAEPSEKSLFLGQTEAEASVGHWFSCKCKAHKTLKLFYFIIFTFDIFTINVNMDLANYTNFGRILI